MRAPNKVLHTKQDTTHFLLLNGDTIQADGKLLTLRWRPTDQKRRQLEHLKHRASQKDETIQRGWSHKDDWLRYILYTGANERENQPVQNRMTGRHLRQVGSSWTTAPAATVHAQRTGTQPGTPLPRSRLSYPSPAAHPRVCWRVVKEQRSPHQPQLQDRSNLNPVQWRSVQQRLTGHNRLNLPEIDGHHDGILSADNGYRLCPTQPSHGYQRESICHQLLGTANDLGQRILPIVPQGVMMTPSWFSAASSTQIEPTLRKRGNPDLLHCSRGVNKIIGNWNRNMNQRQGDIDCAHPYLTMMHKIHPKANMESWWSGTSAFPGEH